MLITEKIGNSASRINDTNKNTPRRQPTFDLSMFSDGLNRNLDYRDFIQNGKMAKTLHSLAKIYLGQHWIKDKDLREVADNIEREYRATLPDREKDHSDSVECVIALDKPNFRGNRVLVKITTERGSDRPDCDRELRSIWFVEDWNAMMEDCASKKCNHIGEMFATIKRFFRHVA